MKTFYILRSIPETLDSEKLIRDCLDTMLKPTYANFIFYVHNLLRSSGYDIAFLQKTIIEANEMEGKDSDKYKFDPFSREAKVLSLTLGKGTKSRSSIKLVDSFAILARSLEDLCKDFNTDVIKDKFPYKFVTKNTLFYEGEKPSRDNYKDISVERYEDIAKEGWKTKEETLEYLEKDLRSLYEIMEKFNTYIYDKYRVQASDSLTISSIALKIYLNNFYKNDIPLINKPSVYKDIKQSYYGGITEVYKPTNSNGELLYYYDVNSLYPWAALNDMPGKECTLRSSINKRFTEDLELFGFFYCTVKVSEEVGLYIGLLPVRDVPQSDGGISLPIGEWSGWYFSEELRFAAKHGYEINVIKGYEPARVSNVFRDYVEGIYKVKSTTTEASLPTEKATSKSLLNNLLGRFGLNIHKGVTKLVDTNSEYYNRLSQTVEITNFIPAS